MDVKAKEVSTKWKLFRNLGITAEGIFQSKIETKKVRPFEFTPPRGAIKGLLLKKLEQAYSAGSQYTTPETVTQHAIGFLDSSKGLTTKERQFLVVTFPAYLNYRNQLLEEAAAKKVEQEKAEAEAKAQKEQEAAVSELKDKLHG